MTCPTGKQCLDHKHALIARERVARREQDRPVAIYRCVQCGHWHVGTHLTRRAKR